MSGSNGDEPGKYDPETQTYRLFHNWAGDDRVSTGIIEAVAALTDTPATDIGPLYEIMDPDALDHLFRPIPDGTRRQAASKLTFTLNDCEVTVFGDGRIEIYVPTED